MKKVLVTGATGFIGAELSRQLAARKWKPRLAVRRPERGALLARLDAELVQADLASPASLRRAVDGVDTVFHLAARASFESYAVLRPSIVEGSLELMRSAREAGVKRFVYAGSLLVYGNQSEAIGPSTPARPVLGYGRAKLEAETLLAEEAARCGMSFASLRLPHVYGATDLLFEQIHRGWVIFPGDGENRFAHLHLHDAARLLIGVAEHGWTGISPVGDDLSCDWNTFFHVVREYYPRVRVQKVPRWLGALGARLLSPLQRLSSAPALRTPGAVSSWNLNLPVEPGLVWKDLGIRPRFATVYEGIPSVLDDCVAFRWRHPLLDTGW